MAFDGGVTKNFQELPSDTVIIDGTEYTHRFQCTLLLRNNNKPVEVTGFMRLTAIGYYAVIRQIDNVDMDQRITCMKNGSHVVVI